MTSPERYTRSNYTSKVYVTLFQLLMGMMRLGFLASFMSDPFISGFTTGAAVHVFSSQIKHVFGVKVHNYYGPLSLIYVRIDSYCC